MGTMTTNQAMGVLAALRADLQRALLSGEWDVSLPDADERGDAEEDITVFVRVRAHSDAEVLWWITAKPNSGPDGYHDQLFLTCTGDNTPAPEIPLVGRQMISNREACDLTRLMFLADDAYNIRQWEQEGAPAGLITLSEQPGLYRVHGSPGWTYGDVLTLLATIRGKAGDPGMTRQ